MMKKNNLLHVHTTQGYAGQLIRESQFIFNYLTEDSCCEIGLTMPLTAQSYSKAFLPGPLRQNLPEGFLLDWIKSKFGKTMKLDDFNILMITGQSTIGRVHCRQSDQTDLYKQGGESLQEMLAWKGTEDLFEYLANKYASISGISGVQPKVLLPQSDKEIVERSSLKVPDLIVKAAGYDYDGLAENEYHCMSIAKQAGLKIPEFWLSDDKHLFITKRFDLDENGAYLGFEDMTSLMGLQNDAKYNSSYENIAKAVKLFSSPNYKNASLLELFKAITLSVAVRNGDAHLKNFGLIYTNPTTSDVALAPLYDVVNTTIYIPKDTLALKMSKTRSWPYRDALIEFGRNHCDIDNPAEIIDAILEIIAAYIPQIETGKVWGLMKAEIDKGCLSLSGGFGSVTRRKVSP